MQFGIQIMDIGAIYRSQPGRRREVNGASVRCNGTFTNGEANWSEVEDSSLTHKAGMPAKDPNTMIIKKSLTAALLCATLFTAPQASAAEPLVLLTDQTQILKLPRPPGTIVVGNPTFADVTVQDQLVYLHGRAFGTTNIIILDEAGDRMGDYEVTVQMGGSNNLALYKGGPAGANRYSYVCAPNCEATLQVGDPSNFISEIAKEVMMKTSLATGKTAVEAPQTGNSGNSDNSGNQQ
jgi:putative type II/III system pilus formation protein